MPALNFQTRFAPLVRSGQKTTSIRRRRLLPGEPVYLMTGQRTATCERLGTGHCTSASEVLIDWRKTYAVIKIDGVVLSEASMSELAKADGFQDLDDFLEFFNQHYGLPFQGYLNRWTLTAPVAVEAS